jgi:alpha-amylase/alpha-mannosidase (GH57 family)
MYPDLEIHFNHKDIINSELDIYIPSLKIAFELNGIFHYEIIYSSDQLTKIQNNDNRKYQACIDKGISLCVIDTSKQKQFKEKTSKIYLDIITSIINGPIA